MPDQAAQSPLTHSEQLLSPEDKLARTKLAIETRLKRADQELARKQFALAEAQFAWEKEKESQRGWRFLTTPAGGILFVAAVGLLGTAAGKVGDYLNTRQQQETSIILKASDVPQSLPQDAQEIQRARNLLWFEQAGYIVLPSDFIKEMRAESNLKPGQILPPPVVQSQATTAVYKSALDLASTFEGFRTKKYQGSVGNWVIGFGHPLTREELASGRVQVGTESIPINDGISEEQGRRILQQDFAPAYKGVDQLVKVPLTREQRDALADLIFNIGAGRFASIALLTKLNQGKYEEVPQELEHLSSLGGMTLPGMQRRREAEADLWKRPPDAEQG